MEPVRGRVLQKFEGALGGDATKAQNLEVCLYNWTVRTCFRDRIARFWSNPKFRYRYTTRALSLCFNLRHPRNPELGDRVRAGEVSVKALANMTPREMFPRLYEELEERRRAEKERLRKKKGKKEEEEVPDGLLTCRRCRSKKTVYMLAQTRSADEPMTAFVTCLACGNRWKE